MKKNFLKKLSFVMAFAMVVTSATPATLASAATKPSMKTTSKVLVLNDEGNTTYDFNINNKASGSTYKWTTSNKAVATVNAKNGVVAAKAIGTAKITCAITKAGKTTKLTSTVTVKANMETITITNVPTAAIEVGAVNDFGRSYTTATKAGKSSDKTKWFITKGNDKAVASIDANGKFVATEAGEFVIEARSYQSTAKFKANVDDYTAISAPVTVKVAASIVGAKQVDLSSANVTFTAPMTDVAKNLNVYAVVGTTKVKQTIKSVTMDATNKIATVVLYVPFSTGATYVVDYTDMKSAEFVAATTELADVTSMVLTTSTVVVGSGTALVVKLLNKNGVDISTSTLLNRVTFASSSEKTYLSGNLLTIFTKNDVTTITATFHSYKYDTTTGAETGNIVATGSVVGTDAVSVTVGAIKAYTIENDSTPDFTTSPNHLLAAEDSGYRLFVKAIKSDATTYTSSDVDAKFAFTSSNTDVLIINSATGMLYPVKAGTAVVVVKYNDVVIDSVTITIGAKRVATNFTLDTYAFTLSNDVDVADTKTVKLDVVDQFGKDIADGDVSISTNAGAPASNLVVSPVIATASAITFNAANATAGTYTYTIKDKGLVKYLVVTVVAPSTQDVSYYKINLSGTTFDTAIKSDDLSEIATIKLYGYASNNVANVKPAVSGGAFSVKITKPDASEVNTDGTYVLAQATSGSAVTKLATGTYKVTAYNGNQVLDVAYFTVKDTQATPVVSTVKLVSTQTTLLAAIKDCFTVKLGDSDVTSTIATGVTYGDGATVFVKDVTYVQTINGATITHTVAVNTTITYAK